MRCKVNLIVICYQVKKQLRIFLAQRKYLGKVEKEIPVRFVLEEGEIEQPFTAQRGSQVAGETRGQKLTPTTVVFYKICNQCSGRCMGSET